MEDSFSKLDQTILKEYQDTDKWRQLRAIEEKVAFAYFKTLDQYRGSIQQEILNIAANKIPDVVNFLHNENKKAFLARHSLSTLNNPLISESFHERIRYNPSELRRPFIYFFKKVKWLVIFNARKLTQLGRKKVHFSLYSFNELARAYVTKPEHGLIIPFYANLKKPYKRELNSSDSEALTKTTESLVANLYEYLGEGVIDKALKLQLFKMLFDYHASFFNDYLLLKAQKHLPKKLVLCSNNRTHSRMSCMAIMANGGEVIGSTHGEPITYYWEKIIWLELVLCSSFIDYNQELAEELTEVIDHSAISFGIKPVAFSLGTQPIIDTVYQKPPSLRHVKKALLVGNAFKLNGFSSVTSFEPITQIHVETSAMQWVQNQGIQVDYKAHPGGALAGKAADLYPNFKTINEQSFEDVVDQYDLIIFYYTRTTTMRAALNSGKDVLIIDLGIEKFHPKSWQRLNERCFFLPFHMLNNATHELFENSIEN